MRNDRFGLGVAGKGRGFEGADTSEIREGCVRSAPSQCARVADPVLSPRLAAPSRSSATRPTPSVSTPSSSRPRRVPARARRSAASTRATTSGARGSATIERTRPCRPQRRRYVCCVAIAGAHHLLCVTLDGSSFANVCADVCANSEITLSTSDLPLDYPLARISLLAVQAAPLVLCRSLRRSSIRSTDPARRSPAFSCASACPRSRVSRFSSFARTVLLHVVYVCCLPAHRDTCCAASCRSSHSRSYSRCTASFPSELVDDLADLALSFGRTQTLSSRNRPMAVVATTARRRPCRATRLKGYVLVLPSPEVLPLPPSVLPWLFVLITLRWTHSTVARLWYAESLVRPGRA